MLHKQCSIFFVLVTDMKLISTLIVFSIFMQTEVKSQIQVGDNLPEFTLNDQNGVEFNSAKMVGKKNLIIYFYPKDDTPGCTKEACTFRDYSKEIAQEDAMIIGISGDSEEDHKKFAAKYKLTYTLLADIDNKVRKLFGVPTNFLGLIPGRVTYVVDKKGIIRHVFNSQTNPIKHVEESLKTLKKINKEQ